MAITTVGVCQSTDLSGVSPYSDWMGREVYLSSDMALWDQRDMARSDAADLQLTVPMAYNAGRVMIALVPQGTPATILGFKERHYPFKRRSMTFASLSLKGLPELEEGIVAEVHYSAAAIPWTVHQPQPQ